jgi:hypothetical protein
VSEQFTIAQFQPTVITTAGPAVTLADATVVLTDSAVLAGGFNPTGTLVFTLKGPAGFSFTQTETIAGNDTYSVSTTLPTGSTVAGTYTWSVTYSGDAKNLSARDQGGAQEQTIISRAQPVLLTVVGVAPDHSRLDVATLSGGYNPTGNIVFTLNGPGGYSFTQNVPVNGNGTYIADSPAPVAPGVYTWTAIYDGDSNNLHTGDQGGVAEQFTIAQFQPTLTTRAGGYITITTDPVVISDTAVLAGGFKPTGTMVFTLKGPDGFNYTQTYTVNGNGSYQASTVLLPTAALGTYSWSVTYSGDVNNVAARDQGGEDEETDVGRQPSLITTASPAVTLGTTLVTISDTAVLTNGTNPTGTITFTLRLVSNLVFTTSDLVTGNGTYSASYTLPTAGGVAGLYTWSTSYNGDTSNLPAYDQGGSVEQTWVYPAAPAIKTEASFVAKLTPNCKTGKPVTIYDTATLSGGYLPTGSILFTLTDPKGRVVSTQSVPVHGDGAYKVGYTITAKGLLGNYKWSAAYTGDANNHAIRDNGQNEMTQVNKTGMPVLSRAYIKAYRPLCPHSPYYGKFDLPVPKVAQKVVSKLVVHSAETKPVRNAVLHKAATKPPHRVAKSVMKVVYHR